MNSSSTDHDSNPCQTLAVVSGEIVIKDCLDLDNQQIEKRVPVKFTPLFFEKIPVNYASKQLLETVKGLGPVTATKILDYRKNSGPVYNTEQLTEIDTIGSQRAYRFSQHISFIVNPWYNQ